jgi:hypothetical protein
MTFNRTTRHINLLIARLINDGQDNGTKYKDFQYNNIQHNDTQHKGLNCEACRI